MPLIEESPVDNHTDPTDPDPDPARVPLAETLLRMVRERIADAEWFGASPSALAMMRRQEADLVEAVTRGETHAPDF